VRLKKYATCVKELQNNYKLSRKQIAELTGSDPAVVSRRMSGKQEPQTEALIVINILADVFASEANQAVFPADGKGWLADVAQKARGILGAG